MTLETETTNKTIEVTAAKETTKVKGRKVSLSPSQKDIYLKLAGETTEEERQFEDKLYGDDLLLKAMYLKVQKDASKVEINVVLKLRSVA